MTVAGLGELRASASPSTNAAATTEARLREPGLRPGLPLTNGRPRFEGSWDMPILRNNAGRLLRGVLGSLTGVIQI